MLNTFKKAMEEQRYAKVSIPMRMIRGQPDIVQLLLAQVLVINVVPCQGHMGLEYEIVHPMFEQCPGLDHSPRIGLREIYHNAKLELLEFCETSERVQR